MCTAITLLTHDHYFGRNLDLEYAYKEEVVITPRNYPFLFRKAEPMHHHYAIIGMAYTPHNYPLYYDATNEKGLSMAGLNFPDNAKYQLLNHTKDNITPFELIPWILGQCTTVDEAIILINKLNLLDQPYSPALPLSPLHWIISDRTSSITVEALEDGIHIHSNPIGVLTNNPPFDIQLSHWNPNISASKLPGNWTSQSRFVKAAFVKMNSVCGETEEESVSQFFHILGSVEHQSGCVVMPNNLYEITQYSSCCNTDKGIYYYRTYDNSQICAIDMHKENLEGQTLISYPLIKEQQILWQNAKK